MNYKTILPFAAAALAMSVGFAAAQATPDSANVPQPHLAAALALAAQENSWRHPGLVSCYLWFAKNASANMSLSRNALIAVMQAAELRDLDDPSHTRDSPRKWALLVEAQMGPRSVVISEI